MWQEFGKGKTLLEENLVLSFLSLSLDLFHEYHVHVKHTRLNLKVLFLVYAILNLIFFLLQTKDVKRVLLHIFLCG